MESIQAVLERRKSDLIEVLVSGTGLSMQRAERFVDLAGTDLVEALVWRNGAVSHDHLSAPSNVRDILGTMGAGQIAQSLGLPRDEVWTALRTFVPHALEIADRCLRA